MGIMENKLKKLEQYVDMRTGEIVKQRERFVDKTLNDEGYLFNKNNKKVNAYINQPLPKELSISDEGRVLRLMRCLNNKDNVLAKIKNRSVSPMSEEEIISVTGLSDRRGKLFLNKLIDLDVIGVSIPNTKYNRRCYCINPIYFFAGKRVNLLLYLTFKKSLDKHLPDYVKEHFDSL